MWDNKFHLMKDNVLVEYFVCFRSGYKHQLCCFKYKRYEFGKDNGTKSNRNCYSSLAVSTHATTQYHV